MIGLPPSSAGAVHSTVSEVASMSNFARMVGEPGFSKGMKNRGLISGGQGPE